MKGYQLGIIHHSFKIDICHTLNVFSQASVLTKVILGDIIKGEDRVDDSIGVTVDADGML